MTPEPTDIAFRNVDVVPMDTERVLTSQTVVVSGGRIAAVGPAAEVEIPAGATVIDGAGATLIPGLANMHGHPGTYDPDPRHLALYLAGGVTTVRGLNSPPPLFAWREQIRRGELLGPALTLSGPAVVGLPGEIRPLALALRAAIVAAIVVAAGLLFAGLLAIVWLAAGAEEAAAIASQWLWSWLGGAAVVGLVLVWRKIIPLTALVARFYPQAALAETPAQARAAVEKQARAGVDFIKPYDYLDRPSFLAALAAARDHGLYTAGHIPDDPDVILVEEALAAGLNEVAHVDELLQSFWPDYTPQAQGWTEWRIDMDRIDAVAAAVAGHDAAVTATLITDEVVLLGLEDIDALFGRPEYALVKPAKLQEWRQKGRMVNWKGQEKYRRQQVRPLLLQLTKALHDQGVPVLVGTDSDVEGIVPGRSEHDEMALLVEAGFSPFAALAAATRDAAQIAGRMGVASDWGTIAPGQRADLVLLAANPLDDIGHTKQRLGAMVRGRWFTQAALDEIVADYLSAGS